MKQRKRFNIQKLFNKGFTLYELMIFIALFGILITLMIPIYLSYVDKKSRLTQGLTCGASQQQVAEISSEAKEINTKVSQ